MFIHLSLTILYSDMEHPSKYSPVTFHLSPATGIFIENRECYLKKKNKSATISIVYTLINHKFEFPTFDAH